ncbi:MAG: MFS transporter [Candidatus Tectimicrobiota bacterium]
MVQHPRVTRYVSLRPVLEGYFRDLPRDVAVLTLVAFCVALGFGILAPVIPVFARSFGVSALAASAVVSVFALMRLLSATPGGWLLNRVGERTVLWIGLGIVALSSALAGFSTSYGQLLLLRGLGGTGSAMFSVSSMSLLLRTVDPAQRGRASSTYQSGFLLGGLAGPTLGGLVVGVSIRAPFFVYAITLTLASLTAYFALPRSTGGPLPERTAGTGSPTAPLTLRRALALRAYWTTLVTNLASRVTLFGLRSSLLPLFVLEALQKSATTSSMGFLLSSLSQACLLLPAGRLTDLRGRKPALVLGTGALASAMLCLVLWPTLAGFYTAMLVLGISAAFLGAAPAAVVGDLVGRQRGGPVVAVFQMTSDLGMVAGPLLVGWLKDATGSFSVPFLMCLAVALGAVVMAGSMPETQNHTATSVQTPSGV